MSTAAKLVLVRHGETEGNVAKLLDTKLPGAPLTERGVAQAKSFGANLVRPPRLLVSSEALRAKQTAAHIAAAVNLEPQVLNGLYEVQLGELDGRGDREAFEAFETIYTDWHFGNLDVRAPGGESGQEVLDRFLPVLNDLRATHLEADAEGDVLVVIHGAAMRLVAKALTGFAPEFSATNHLDNTETIELLPVPSGGYQCLRWGKLTPPFDVREHQETDDPMG
ncbi:histidine phosphatase family protein [Nocardia camponoti]|uniref:Phosphoglycerate mutase n=1 Tax=Nocardia camponoti TaxID=1616106 RepID=A0A917QKM7_9NOCA|nr:histidine phosphatase family protein [Nocardia camponoti]GGK55328.1 putative phosphoglycerate mutase [Nocardia camponoti]